MTTDQIIEKLKLKEIVNLGPYYKPQEIKNVLADVRVMIPGVWARRSNSTNNWLLYNGDK